MLLTKDEIKNLTGRVQGPCVSIYMSTHRGTAETQQDRTRLKNLLREAEELLRSRGLRTPEERMLLEPAELLLNETPFWMRQRGGLAIFISPESFGYYIHTYPFEELTMVAERFYLKPLIPILGGEERFYILAISQNKVRLIEGSRDTVCEVELEEIPKNLAEAMRYDDFKKQTMVHSRTASVTGRRSSVMHGQGPGMEVEKVDILHFFQNLDRGLQSLFKNENVPLVLAGVEYLLSLYRQANTYANLAGHIVAGNPDRLTSQELHSEAWKIVQPFYQKREQDAIARFQEYGGTGRSSGDMSEIIQGAATGRVESLFVAKGIQKWGNINRETLKIEPHAKPEPHDEDLLDFAAIQALLHDGVIYMPEPGDMPVKSPLAAIFRY